MESRAGMAAQSTTEILDTLKDTLKDAVAPKLVDVLEAAAEKLTPDAAKEQAEVMLTAASGEAVHPGGRKWPWLVVGAALAAGVGAAVVVLRRRRTTDEWDDQGWPEYRPDAGSPDQIDLTTPASTGDAADAAETLSGD
jgi:hypothetical protein